MLGKTYIKTIIREIIGSFGRFAAIFWIVTLGVSFLSGLLATTPNMKTSMDRYFKRTNMMDIFIKSTMGFTNDDVQAVKNLSEVDVVLPAYVTDAMVKTTADDPVAARIYGLPLERNNESDFINSMDLVEGRFPENDNECVVQIGGGYLSFIEIGTELTITESPDFENLDDVYKQTQYKVTGIVKSPLFISFDREPSNAGSGNLGMVIFVRDSCYALSVYTDLFVLLKNRDSFTGFTDAYEDFVNEAIIKIEDTGVKRSVPRQEEVIAEAERQLELAQEELADGEAQLAGGRELFLQEKLKVETELQENEQLLRNGTEEIAAARETLAQAKIQLDDAAEQVERYRGSNFRRAREGIAAYDAGLAEYNEGLRIVTEHEKELEQGWAAFYSGRRRAMEEFALAEAEFAKHEEEIRKGYAEIAEARQNILENVPLPKWYVLDRNSNVGCFFYRSNVEKIADVAQVFPIFFLLVAALVALTTMTRMVEEERMQIGTLKALGYRKRMILVKYLVYCALTGVLGSAAGIVLGFRILPAIIYNAFAAVYHLPPLVTEFYLAFGIIACGSILACTMGATIYSCYHSLWEKPAFLLIPKSPKSGKRIFLERIPFIWNRMKFTYKVTARNLMRRKRHFFMTVIGIAGCTALMTAGFGLRDSVTDIAQTQFEEIWNYDLQIKLIEEDLTAPYLNELDNLTPILSESGYIIKDNKRSSLNIIVPKDTNALSDFIKIRDRRAKNPLVFTDTDVILTEMAALHYDLKVGDTFTLENSNGIDAVFTLSGITENYVGVTAYLGSEVYAAQFKEELFYTTILANSSLHSQSAQDNYAARLLAEENVLAVEFKSQVQRSYNNLLGSMVFVVLIIVIASGALAMIVLYNLTNININERTREIATLRVLGYHKTEAAVIIFREIAILSIIGTIAGLFLGIPLHRFITGVAETIEMMFGRGIAPLSFILSGVFTMLFSTGVDLFMLKKIGSIKMAESMKRE